jgi:hypothetical protein
MRSILFLCAFLMAAPACAGPLTACDFITQAEVEKIVGAPVSPPIVQELNICAGYCASLNSSRCEFMTTEAKPREFFLCVELPPYLLTVPQERIPFLSYRSEDMLVQDVPGFGKDAIWFFDYYWTQSEFASFPRPKVRIQIHETGTRPSRALADAISATSIALRKYDALTPAELKDAWYFRSIEGRYPWKP